MRENDPATPDPNASSRRNLWQRRIADPIVTQLTQGLTPQKIALTIAIGSSIAMFPILGTTTAICVAAGVFMKLNQPIIQAVNYACTPLHLPFIFLSFQWGEKLFGGGDTTFRLRPMMKLLQEHPLDFVTTYGQTALHACVIWCVLVPFWGVGVYYLALPIVREIERVRLESAAKAANAKAEQHPVP